MSKFWEEVLAGFKFIIMAFCVALAMGLGFCLSAVIVFDPAIEGAEKQEHFPLTESAIEDYKQKVREAEMERDCGEIKAVGVEGVQMEDGTFNFIVKLASGKKGE